MKSPLRYQATEYDCGTTSITNALMFLFDREELPPDVISHIGQCTLDGYDEHGRKGIYGTSGASIQYFGSWFNELRFGGLLPIKSQFFKKSQVRLEKDDKLYTELKNGSAIVLHVFLNNFGHYVLVTGVQEDKFFIFDPYYPTDPKVEKKWIKTKPCSYNRIVPAEVLYSLEKTDCSMGPIKTREALVIQRY